MFIFERHIGQSILLPLVIFTILITGLIWIFQIIKFIYLIDKNIELTQFCKLIMLLVPHLLYMILPISTVISVIYTYSRLTADKQLIILKNAGISNIGLAKPALLIASVITLACYYISITVIPDALMTLNTELHSFNNNYFSSIIVPKMFNQVSKDVTIYVDKKLPHNTMQGVIVFDDRIVDNPAILFAKYGQITTNNKGNFVVQLIDGTRQSYDKGHNINALHFASVILELTRGEKVMQNSVKEYYIRDLLNPSANFPIIKRNILISEGHERIIWPLYTFLLTFCTLAVFLKIPYNKKSNVSKLLCSTFVIVAAIGLYFVFINMAHKNVSTIVLSYLNCVLFIVFGAFLYISNTRFNIFQ